MARRASARSPMPAVAPSVRPMTVAALGATHPWRHRIPRLWMPGQVSRSWIWSASIARSTPRPNHSVRRARVMSTTRGTRTIRTDYLARVEGEGAMYVRLEGNEVREVKLRIYEPPRFFEAFLRGRAFTEAPDITARICGICPVAYQTS